MPGMSEVDPLVRLSWTHGLGVVLSIIGALALIGMMAWLLRYVMRENSKREERMAQILNGSMGQLVCSFTTLADRVKQHDEDEREAWRWQREEHKEILAGLRRVAERMT